MQREQVDCRDPGGKTGALVCDQTLATPAPPPVETLPAQCPLFDYSQCLLTLETHFSQNTHSSPTITPFLH